MPRPLHRSITLWSGILIIAFVGWAWSTSYRAESWCRYNCFSAGNTHGGVELNSVYSGSGFITWPNRMRASLLAPAMPAPFLLRGTGSPSAPITHRAPTSYRDSLEIMMTRRDPQAWLLFIPHWLILLAVILPWAVLLRWQAQRRKQAP